MNTHVKTLDEGPNSISCEEVQDLSTYSSRPDSRRLVTQTFVVHIVEIVIVS